MRLLACIGRGIIVAWALAFIIVGFLLAVLLLGHVCQMVPTPVAFAICLTVIGGILGLIFHDYI